MSVLKASRGLASPKIMLVGGNHSNHAEKIMISPIPVKNSGMETIAKAVIERA